jgi:hypothetical protein
MLTRYDTRVLTSEEMQSRPGNIDLSTLEGVGARAGRWAIRRQLRAAMR